jgi:cytochrome c oxidase assembly factor CtaG
LRTESWHILQHLCFVGSALLFWWAMLHRANEALAAMCLFATSTIGGALGALMALSNSPWYSSYAAMGLTPFGLSPAEDQQFAGLIMWIPGGLFHLGAALWFLARWLSGKGGRDAFAAK